MRVVEENKHFLSEFRPEVVRKARRSDTDLHSTKSVFELLIRLSPVAAQHDGTIKIRSAIELPDGSMRFRFTLIRYECLLEIYDMEPISLESRPWYVRQRKGCLVK